ncbi:unnamed protein product [Meloidogyne enterolobii]|uniref:Uncharacterized protein n=1 Tax=Meloidogyne enterolobii TaxID=390850 RepID=A0ACB0XRK8_MELEN
MGIINWQEFMFIFSIFDFIFKIGLNFACHVPYFIPLLQRFEFEKLISISFWLKFFKLAFFEERRW